MLSLRLQEMPVLSSLPQSDWEKVKDLFVEKHFGKDEYIFFEGDVAWGDGWRVSCF